MLMYQMQRGIMIEKGAECEFPNTVEIEVQFASDASFPARGRLLEVDLCKDGAIPRIYPETGKGGIAVPEDAHPLSVAHSLEAMTFTEDGQSYTFPEIHFTVEDTCLRVRTRCRTMIELSNMLYRITWLIPNLLSVQLQDAVFAQSISGRVGATPFSFAIPTTCTEFPVGTPEAVREKIRTALVDFGRLQNIRSVRLDAALHYHNTAKRLLEVGFTRWEFMGEAILNLAKVLEVLFVGPGTPDEGPVDAIRRELSSLGYSNEQISVKFDPLLFLRNHWDVGHAKLAIPSQQELRVLYDYLQHADNAIRYMLQSVIEQASSGRHPLLPDPDLALSPEDKRKWEQMRTSVSQHLPNIPANVCDSGGAGRK